MNRSLDNILFEGIVSIRDRLLAMPDPLRLESGEPSFDTPQHVKDALNKALKENHTHYAPSIGIKPLREAVLRKLQRDNRISYLPSPDNVLITSGGMHALYITFRSILNDGDEVIVPVPNWTATGWIIKLCGGELLKVRLRAELGHRWDPADLARAITPRTKAILINTPHNPTGSVFSREDLRAILELAEKHDLYVVSDEAYEHVIYEDKHISVAAVADEFSPRVRDQIISCFTFSKSYAMTGWRVGYAVSTNKTFLEQAKKMILYSINGVSTPSQYAAIAALDGPQDEVWRMRDEYKKRRDLLYQGVNQCEFFKCEILPKGAFYLYADITDAWTGTPWELVHHLVNNFALGCVPGDIFLDTKPSIRFAYACSTGMIERAIGLFKQVVTKTNV